MASLLLVVRSGAPSSILVPTCIYMFSVLEILEISKSNSRSSTLSASSLGGSKS